MHRVRDDIADTVSHLGTVCAIALLLVSWLFAYLALMAFTEGVGAPWDIAPIRPPLGHWQRTINDFFESGIGAYLPTAIFLLGQVGLFLWAVRRVKVVGRVAVVLGLTTIAGFDALLFLVGTLRSLLPARSAHLTPDDWQYWGDFLHTWPLGPAVIAVLVALFVVQTLIVRRLSAE